MRNFKYFLPVLGVILLVGLVVTILNNSKSNGPQVKQEIAEQVKEKTFPAQTDEQEGVSVEVTPQTLSAGSEAVFQVSLNTHSVELGEDLAAVSKLKDDKGNVYQANSWTGGKGGHHLSGNLTFPKISPQASSVELIISGVAGIERKFKWEL